MKRISIGKRVFCQCVLLVVLLGASSQEVFARDKTCNNPKAKSVHDALIKFKNSSYEDGSVVFLFRPKGASPTEISVEVKDGWSAEKVAIETRAELDRKLGLDYDIDLRDKRKVKIDTAKGPKFCLMVKEVTVGGLVVEVDY